MGILPNTPRKEADSERERITSVTFRGNWTPNRKRVEVHQKSNQRSISRKWLTKTVIRNSSWTCWRHDITDMYSSKFSDKDNYRIIAAFKWKRAIIISKFQIDSLSSFWKNRFNRRKITELVHHMHREALQELSLAGPVYLFGLSPRGNLSVNIKNSLKH